MVNHFRQETLSQERACQERTGDTYRPAATRQPRCHCCRPNKLTSPYLVMQEYQILVEEKVARHVLNPRRHGGRKTCISRRNRAVDWGASSRRREKRSGEFSSKHTEMTLDLRAQGFRRNQQAPSRLRVSCRSQIGNVKLRHHCIDEVRQHFEVMSSKRVV